MINGTIGLTTYKWRLSFTTRLTNQQFTVALPFFDSRELLKQINFCFNNPLIKLITLDSENVSAL